jgi:hypothetical protein
MEVRFQVGDILRCDFVARADGIWTAEAAQAGTSYVLEARAGPTNGKPAIAYGQVPVSVPAEPATGILDVGEVILQTARTTPVGGLVGTK